MMRHPEILKTAGVIALAALGAGAALCLVSDKAQNDTWTSFLLIKMVGIVLLGGALAGYFWLESTDRLPRWFRDWLDEKGGAR